MLKSSIKYGQKLSASCILDTPQNDSGQEFNGPPYKAKDKVQNDKELNEDKESQNQKLNNSLDLEVTKTADINDKNEKCCSPDTVSK